jgi:hypothetical protein
MNRFLTRIACGTFAGAMLLMAAKVTTDYDHKTDFSQYKTYSWMSVKAGDPLWSERIMDAVNEELSAKGLINREDGGDASVSAFASTRAQPRLETFYTGFGGGWFWRGFGDGYAYTTIDRIPIGTLVVDIFDTPTKKLIWRGTASDALSDKPDSNEKKLEKAVAEMFRHFPPMPRT